MVADWGFAIGYVRKHPWKYALLCALALLLTISVFGVVFTQTIEIVEKMQKINDLSVAVTPQLGGNLQDPSSMAPLLKQYKSILEDYNSVRTSALILLFGVFGLWILFGGAFWYVCEQKKLRPYGLHFIGLSALWYAVFLLVCYVVFKLMAVGIQGMGTAAIQPVVTSLLMIVIVLFFFASVSFVLIGDTGFWKLIPQTFRVISSHFLFVFVSFSNVFIGFVFACLLVVGLGRLLPVLSLIGFFIVFLYIPLAAIYFRKRIQSIVSHRPAGKKSQVRSGRRPKASG